MEVILHNIRSIYNVGSIFRTADALGVKKIYLCGITPRPIDEFGRMRRPFAKVSIGAEKYVEWEYHKSTAKLMDKLKKSRPGKNYKIFAVEQGVKSTPYYKICLSMAQIGNLGLVMGNEVRGLPLSVLKKADKILEIPMRGKTVGQDGHPRRLKQGKESLNVSVAFGIAAFHLMNLTGK